MSFMLFGWAVLAGVFLFDENTPEWARPYLAGIVGLLILGGLALEVVDRLKDNDS